MFHQDVIRVDPQINDDPDLKINFKDIEVLKDPCSGCPFSNECALKLLACRQFYKFIHREDEGERPEDDIPTRETYIELYPTEAREVNQDIQSNIDRIQKLESTNKRAFDKIMKRSEGSIITAARMAIRGELK